MMKQEYLRTVLGTDHSIVDQNHNHIEIDFFLFLNHILWSVEWSGFTDHKRSKNQIKVACWGAVVLSSTDWESDKASPRQINIVDRYGIINIL